MTVREKEKVAAITLDNEELLSMSDEDLRKLVGEVSFDIKGFWDRMQGSDVWQQLLQAHLYYDHILTTYLREALVKPRAIQLERLGFAQKLQLIEAMGLLPKWMINFVSYLNRLRNNIAHDLHAVISDHEQRNLIHHVPVALRDELTGKTPFEDGITLGGLLVLMAAHIDEARRGEAFRRLKQRQAMYNAAKAHQHLARVLREIDGASPQGGVGGR